MLHLSDFLFGKRIWESNGIDNEKQRKMFPSINLSNVGGDYRVKGVKSWRWWCGEKSFTVIKWVFTHFSFGFCWNLSKLSPPLHSPQTLSKKLWHLHRIFSSVIWIIYALRRSRIGLSLIKRVNLHLDCMLYFTSHLLPSIWGQIWTERTKEMWRRKKLFFS
jgi:hypothetical protein